MDRCIGVQMTNGTSENRKGKVDACLGQLRLSRLVGDWMQWNALPHNRTLRGVLVVGALFLTCAPAHEQPQCPMYVPLHAAIARAAKYDGARIMVAGVYWHGFERSALSHTSVLRPREPSLPKEEIWIEFTPGCELKDTCLPGSPERCYARFCVFEGIFDSARLGHMGRYGGTLVVDKIHDAYVFGPESVSKRDEAKSR